jgi:hypothetical protein
MKPEQALAARLRLLIQNFIRVCSLQRELLLPFPFFTCIVAEYEGDLTILSL